MVAQQKSLILLRKPSARVHHGTCEDISVVHSTVTNEGKVSPKGSMANELGVSHLPVPWGKLTKATVMDAFKDVHTGFGISEPTAWISNSVYREKPDGSIRV